MRPHNSSPSICLLLLGCCVLTFVCDLVKPFIFPGRGVGGGWVGGLGVVVGWCEGGEERKEGRKKKSKSNSIYLFLD